MQNNSKEIKKAHFVNEPCFPKKVRELPNSYCDKQRYPWNDYVSQILKASRAKSDLITPPLLAPHYKINYFT